MGKIAKKAWPACVVHITSGNNDYLKDLINIDLANQYRGYVGNLHTLTLPMKAGDHKIDVQKMGTVGQWVMRSVLNDTPSNIFVIMDTHSDEYTSILQHTSGTTGPDKHTASEIIQTYLGKPLMTAMKAASLAAREDETVETTINGGTPWYNTTPKARGGRRGLFLVTRGPAMQVKTEFEELLAMVELDIFDFVIGFGGSSTLPGFVGPTVLAFIRTAAVFGGTDVWESLCDLLVTNPDVLEHTTVIAVYACYVNGKRTVESREVAKHSTYRAFGYKFSTCANEGCNSSMTDTIRVSRKENMVQMTCAKCHWKSAWLPTDQDNGHFLRVKPATTPTLFWHNFPPSPGLHKLFVDTMPGTNTQEGKEKRSPVHTNVSSSRRPAKLRRLSGTVEWRGGKMLGRVKRGP
ncbi:hypothetical protein BDR05DRAFT_1005609 [Suillus weaverae]|nr:hypothetical protein BDR05DRAFT_1005609 [Suillus weaverae]